jgi:hypothetical protein
VYATKQHKSIKQNNNKQENRKVKEKNKDFNAIKERRRN